MLVVGPPVPMCEGVHRERVKLVAWPGDTPLVIEMPCDESQFLVGRRRSEIGMTDVARLVPELA